MVRAAHATGFTAACVRMAARAAPVCTVSACAGKSACREATPPPPGSARWYRLMRNTTTTNAIASTACVSAPRVSADTAWGRRALGPAARCAPAVRVTWTCSHGQRTCTAMPILTPLAWSAPGACGRRSPAHLNRPHVAGLALARHSGLEEPQLCPRVSPGESVLASQTADFCVAATPQGHCGTVNQRACMDARYPECTSCQ